MGEAALIPRATVMETIFDWFTGMDRADARDSRAGLMATVMLAPGTLLLSSLGILAISGAAAALIGQPWAKGWFGLDLILLTLRLWPTMRYGNAMPHGVLLPPKGLTGPRGFA